MDTKASSYLADNTVRQFTRDNDVSVEFDAYGFSVKDYQTGWLFLRCDSTGDLYLVTQQPSSQTPIVLLSFSSTTWHRRMSHLGNDVLRLRQFTRDNDVSVEFDAYGFSVKDYQTGWLLLRCDSTGDLYPVTQQPSSQTPIVLLSFSSTTWHRRMGHLGNDVLRRLELKILISCRKSKLSALCHACQL
nr:ribonuclease H-like domain-containing protein [Tanacetum cinerariifolium]